MKNESLVSELKEALAGADYMPEIIPGDEGVIEVSVHSSIVSSFCYLKIRQITHRKLLRLQFRLPVTQIVLP